MPNLNKPKKEPEESRLFDSQNWLENARIAIAPAAWYKCILYKSQRSQSVIQTEVFGWPGLL